MFNRRPLLWAAAVAAAAGIYALSTVLGRTAAEPSGAEASASPALSASPAVPSDHQAAPDGQQIYMQYCLACHAADGHGTPGKFPDITNKFRGQKDPYDKAYTFISRNMPQNAPGSLQEDEYKAVVNYVLSLNGVPTDFSDIAGHWAENEIRDLADKRYIDGYAVNGDLLFKPDQNITRAEFVRFLVKTKELFLSNGSDSAFADSARFKNDRVYIMTAVDNGLIDGFEDHTFRPELPITRAEIAAILTRSELLPAGRAAYSDVPEDDWAAPAIGAVSSAKLFGGYEDGTFRPRRALTRAEAAVVLYRLLHPEE